MDRIGGGETLPIMVYGDLSKVLSAPGSTIELPTRGVALSPAALTAVKLLTIRLEKGSKDKLQALLLIEENGADEAFREELPSSAVTLRAGPDRGRTGGCPSCLSGNLRGRDARRRPIERIHGNDPRHSAWTHDPGGSNGSPEGGEMSRAPLTTAERWRCHQRDLKPTASAASGPEPFPFPARPVDHPSPLPAPWQDPMAPLLQNEEAIRLALRGGRSGRSTPPPGSSPNVVS